MYCASGGVITTSGGEVMRHAWGGRIIGLFFLALAVTIGIGGVVLTRLAAPDGDHYRIAGFAIGEEYERTIIPRRAPSCATPPGERHIEACRLTIAGRELVAEVTHDDNDYNFPACRVRYGDREGSCWASNSTVSGPTYAAMSRVGLGLSSTILANLEDQQAFTNWREADWRRGGTIATTLIAALLAFAALLLLPQHLPVRALGAFYVGGMTWVAGWFFSLLALLSAGLID